MPFAIPQKWKWVPVNKIIELISGRDLDKSLIEEKASSSSVPYITGASQISNNDVLVNRWTNNGSVFSNTGDLLLTCKGTVGKLAINQIGICHIARQIMAIRPKDQISGDFAKIFFSAIGNKLTSNAKSMIPGISRNDVLSLLCPLPPIEEQQRIVAKLNELLSLVETYGKEQEALEKMEKEFPDKLRASLLQEAIQGKLVPQLESEPAVTQIGEIPEEMPFAIPEKWKWLKLDKFSEKRRTVSPDAITGEVELWSIPAYDAGSPERVNSKQIGSSKKEVVNGDVLLSKIVPNIKRAWIVKSDHPHKLASTEWLTFSGKNILDPEFMRQVFLSPYFRGKMMDTISGMGSLKRANPKMLQKVLIPVPPLHEQRRIVAKLNELLDSVSQLERTISTP